MMNKILKGCLIILITCVEFRCTNSFERNNSPEKIFIHHKISLSNQQLIIHHIQLVKFCSQEVQDRIHGWGYVQIPPNNIAKIISDYTGVISSIGYLVGEKVKKDQEIVRIKSREFINQQEEYIDLYNAFLSIKSPNQSRFVSQRSILNKSDSAFGNAAYYQSLQSLLLKEKNSLKRAGINIDSLESGHLHAEYTILAPIPGYISHEEFSPGQAINKGDFLCKILNPDSLQADIKLDSGDYTGIEKDQPFQIQMNPGKAPMQGTLINIEYRNQSERITGEFNCPGIVNPGTKGEVVIFGQTHPGWLLPYDAVYKEESGNIIFALKKNDSEFSINPTPVKVIKLNDSFYEVLSNNEFKPDSSMFIARNNLYYLTSMIIGK